VSEALVGVGVKIKNLCSIVRLWGRERYSSRTIRHYIAEDLGAILLATQYQIELV
jgi:hypothetical protein